MEADSKLTSALAETDPDLAYLEYAKHGIWHEALHNISEQIERNPTDADLRTARAHLLDQIGRKSAARWDRDFASR